MQRKGFGLLNQAQGRSSSVGAQLPEDNSEFQHVAAVRDGEALRIYVGGKLATMEVKVNEDKLTNRSPGDFALGYTGGATRMAGAVDEVRISKIARYNSDFTPQRRFDADTNTLALYHFDEGQGDTLTDSSGHNHHGKIVGAKWVKE